MDCAYCRDNLCRVWIGQWHCPGCRARLLARLPSREFRLGWMHRWRAQGEAAMADAVVAILKTVAEESKQECPARPLERP